MKDNQNIANAKKWLSDNKLFLIVSIFLLGLIQADVSDTVKVLVPLIFSFSYYQAKIHYLEKKIVNLKCMHDLKSTFDDKNND